MNPQPNRFFQLSLVFLFALNLVPHFADYTVPTLAVGGLCLAWRLLYEFQYVPLPNGITKFALVITLSYLIFLNYGTLLGLEAGSALLICAASLKVIDRVAYRDAMVLLFLNFMLLLARFFESQTLGITIFAFFDLVMTTALLVQLHAGKGMRFDLLSLLKTGARLTLQITPFMILLFFVFPRFSTKFIQAQRPTLQQTGFNDKLEPGQVSELAQIDQIAFRVRFEGEVPPMTERYWRGAILTQNNGMSWARGKILTKKLPQGSPLGAEQKQEILLEPNFNTWLFALDYPRFIEQQNSRMQSLTRVSEGSIFSMTQAPTKRFLYRALSSSQSRDELEPDVRRFYLLGPQEKDPRVLQLVAEAQQDTEDAELIAGRLLRFYQREFRYTLKPGKMKTNELGEFLFEKKEGFCEHFAASFAALMRLAQVPARVVVGFQGGRKNDLSDYFLVSSRDAHAWTEIWSDQKQSWVRIDPTDAVSPLRNEMGGDLFHSLSEDEILARQNRQDFESQYGIWQRAYLAYDALSTNWNLFLLSYDESGQQSFFAKLGFQNINQNLLLSVSLFILLAFFLWVRRRSREHERPENPAQKAYLNLRKGLLKKGLEKESYEGPADFLQRCEKSLPTLQDPLASFRQAYLASEYGQQRLDYDFHQAGRRLEKALKDKNLTRSI